MKVYTAKYNSMTEESAYYTISIHKTKQGARDALAKHIRKEKTEQDNRYKDEKPSRMTFYYFQILWHIDWYIGEMEILD